MENEVKTIKGIDAETCLKFKLLAIKRRTTMGELFETMLKEYEKNASYFWKDILKGERIISDKEAEEMHKISRKIRKEWGFRNVPRS